MRDAELTIYGRNPVLEAFRSGKTVDRLFLQEGMREKTIPAILRAARKQDAVVDYVPKDRLDEICGGGAHQGVAAYLAAFRYYGLDEILAYAREKGEDPFLFLLDGIEDPHNLGAMIRTANLCGAHGVILPKRRAAGLTSAAHKASAGALNYTRVCRVTNLSACIEELKKAGIWLVCADAGGEEMYRLDLRGPIGLVIGGEGDGVSRLVREHCDFFAAIPMRGEIDSLNASVACGVLAYEILRQRRNPAV